MKYLLLTFFTLFSFSTFGQAITKDSVSGKYQAQGIILVDNIKSDDIYTKTKEWIILNYKSAKDVIQLADKESSKIIVKGNFKSNMFMKEGWISHTLIFDFKDGKTRYTYSDFSYYSPGSGEIDFESKNMAFKKSIIKSTEKDIQNAIEKLKKHLLQNEIKKDEW